MSEMVFWADEGGLAGLGSGVESCGVACSCSVPTSLRVAISIDFGRIVRFSRFRSPGFSRWRYILSRPTPIFVIAASLDTAAVSLSSACQLRSSTAVAHVPVWLSRADQEASDRVLSPARPKADVGGPSHLDIERSGRKAGSSQGFQPGSE